MLFKNLGKAVGSVEFDHGYGPMLTLEPKVLKVNPKEEARVAIKYKSLEAGLFQGSVSLKSDAILVKDRIDIHATTVEYARFVIDGKGVQTSNFDFGQMYVG